jgi:hypothetical protein
MRNISMTAALLLAFSVTDAAVAGPAPASGTVKLDGTTWTVADALAYPDGDAIYVVVSNKAFDRNAMSKDGKLDTFDFMDHADGEVDTFSLRISAEHGLTNFSALTAAGSNSGFSSELSDSFKLDALSAERVAGSLKFPGDDEMSADIRFDLPITRKLERSGTKLAAGGGEIGKALIAHFAAMASGDKNKLLEVTPPDRRAMQKEMMDAPDAAEMFDFLKAMTPTQIVVTGGVVNGDSAVLDFTGKRDGQTMRGSVDGTKIDGRWYFNNVETTEG